MHLAGAAHDVVGPTELLARTARSDARFRTTALRESALFRASKFLIFDAPPTSRSAAKTIRSTRPLSCIQFSWAKR